MVSRRDEVRVRYSFFSEVVIVTFESADDTTVVLVDNLVGVMASLGVFVGFGSVVLSTVLSAVLSTVLSAVLSAVLSELWIREHSTFTYTITSCVSYWSNLTEASLSLREKMLLLTLVYICASYNQ